MFSFTGSDPIDSAKKCFAENLRLFGNASTQPEKYNLYNGLANLATAVEELQTKLSQIEATVNRISRDVKNLDR
jgi:hypothetical protein